MNILKTFCLAEKNTKVQPQKSGYNVRPVVIGHTSCALIQKMYFSYVLIIKTKVIISYTFPLAHTSFPFYFQIKAKWKACVIV